MIKTKTFKRSLSVLLAFLVAFTTIIMSAETVGAAGTTGTLSFESGISWGKRTAFTSSNGTNYVFSAGEMLNPIKVGGQVAYCIVPGASCHAGNSYTKDISTLWNSLKKEQQTAVSLATTYGYPNNTSGLVGTNAEKYAATQLIIWEFMCDYRGLQSTNYARTNSVFFDGMSNHANVVTNYNRIVASIQKHWNIPSFAEKRVDFAPTYNMNYNSSTGYYSVTLTDTNNVLSEYDFTTDISGVTSTRYGNQLVITSTKDLSTTIANLGATKHNAALEHQ